MVVHEVLMPQHCSYDRSLALLRTRQNLNLQSGFLPCTQMAFTAISDMCWWYVFVGIRTRTRSRVQ